MKLYHGSNVEIKEIDLNKCRPYKDFGKGFYLTAIKVQAEQMARRTSAIYGGEGVITEFIFDYDTAQLDANISIKHFDKPNKEWALFVMANRKRLSTQPYHNFDIVIGPVADDTIATLFRNFDNGVIDIDMLVSGLQYKDVSSQYLFHTQNSLKYLSCNE